MVTQSVEGFSIGKGEIIGISLSESTCSDFTHFAADNMAGSGLLSNIIDQSELSALSQSTVEKIETHLNGQIAQIEELKTNYEKLRVNSGKSGHDKHNIQHMPYNNNNNT